MILAAQPVFTERAKRGVLEMKGFLVRLDRIAHRLPGRQPTLEELDPEELKCQYATQNHPAGFVAGAGAVNNCVFFFGDQRRTLQQLFRWNPLCPQE